MKILSFGPFSNDQKHNIEKMSRPIGGFTIKFPAVNRINLPIQLREN
jgi:hypothetical protein